MIEVIHNPNKRVYARSARFEYKKYTDICLLDFLNAPKYFVTEFGLIWKRDEFVRSKPNELIYRNYLPTVVRDKYYRVPWVHLRTEDGYKWIPLDLIVGWAFQPTEDKQLRYFNYDLLGISYQMENKYLHPTNTLELPEDSLYRKFITELYA